MEKTGTTARSFRYDPEPGPLSMTVTGAGTHFLTSDWLGSVSDMTAVGGTREYAYTYEPFGAGAAARGIGAATRDIGLGLADVANPQTRGQAVAGGLKATLADGYTGLTTAAWWAQAGIAEDGGCGPGRTSGALV